MVRTRLTFLIFGLTVALTGACGGEAKKAEGDGSPAPAEGGDSAAKPAEGTGGGEAEDPEGSSSVEETADPNAVIEELEGEIKKKKFSKTLESWNAGGADYYVLAVADPESLEGDRKTAEEGVILRPSKAVKYADFEKMIGKPVLVKGKFLMKKPYRPLPNEQVPEGVQNMEVTARGGGFQVVEMSEK